MPARVGPLCAAALHQPPPLLLLPSGYQRQHHKLFFHSTSIRRDDIDDKNHYETLNVQTNASPTDIKKSFYTLSKTHHPDHNRSDPNASRRFMRISEAYTTLSNTERRAKYDRDVLRLHESNSSSSSNIPRGSYSSTGPAGGRPASGLSRRRGTFRGPPPSFYRNGGWGAHGGKRSAAHEESTGGGAHAAGARSHQEQQARAGGYTSYNAGGMGPGQEPFGRGSASSHDMPHFGREAQAAHTRTQERIYQRARRVERRESNPDPNNVDGMSNPVRFLAILGVFAFAITVPSFFSAVAVAMQGGGKNKVSTL